MHAVAVVEFVRNEGVIFIFTYSRLLVGQLQGCHHNHSDQLKWTLRGLHIHMYFFEQGLSKCLRTVKGDVPAMPRMTTISYCI